MRQERNDRKLMGKLSASYPQFLSKLKELIVTERVRAVMSANMAMILLYWDIGKSILEHQEKEGWGAKVIDRLSHDLKTLFPKMKGFSPRNLKYMRKFAQCWPDREFVQRTAAQIPWRSNQVLLDKIEDPEIRQWYVQKSLEYGMGRDMLIFQIEQQLHRRQGKATTNFQKTLSPAESDMTTQVFKDPYLFDFLGTVDLRQEAELEQKLIDHIQRFLLELGQGFAFVGRQVLLEVGNQDFYPDLLFYHLKLRCYIVIELKIGVFKPEHIGQLNFYLNVVDDLLCQPEDRPTIGLLLVKDKNKTIVEYALAGIQKPIGVANWERHITKSLPEELKSSLPTIEEIEAELADKDG